MQDKKADQPGPRRRLVVGVTGSSAPRYGIRLIESLSEVDSVETHLILSDQAAQNLRLEAGVDPTHLTDLADQVYEWHDYAAAVSSGSYLTMGMAIVPCSMNTLAAIAHGLTPNLIARAADVTLKERRRLVVVPRETPLSLVHLRNMVTITEAGATVLPPMPAFYHAPQTIDDLIDQTVGKVLDQFGIEHTLFARWSDPDEGSSR